MIDAVDDEILNIGLRRHSDDKLTYKLIIANSINECRRTEDNSDYYKSVKALKNLLSFNIKGYDLKEQIDEIIAKLEADIVKKYQCTNPNIPRYIFFSKKNQANLKEKNTKWYWESLFISMLQILASEGLLFDTEKVVPIRVKKDTEGYIDDVEGDTRDTAIDDI